MKQIKKTKLSKEQANYIEGLLTYKEVSNSLHQMKSAKSPGISGFTAEIFHNILETTWSLCT